MIAILHNIRSLHNVGSIFRTADAAGLTKLYLCGITPSPLDEFNQWRPQLIKASLGAEKTVAWDGSARSPQAISKLLGKLKKDGYQVLALEINKKAIPYYQLKMKNEKLKTALVLGNEIKGLPVTILSKCDQVIKIPMYGQKESLNVAVAFGIVAFDILRKKL